jgi:hypothetical protein
MKPFTVEIIILNAKSSMNVAVMQPKEKAAETWHANWYNFYPLVERPKR